jgi:hypothetical protein
MEAKDGVVNQCSEREVVEQIRKELPYISIAIFTEAFVVETVDLGDLSGFMVASKDGDSVGIANFEGYQERDGLN